MEYSIKEFSELAGVSRRTLRYYDEIGLLKPARINVAGYRFYGSNEVDKLQDILFYKELGVSLADIKNILNSSTFDRKKVLNGHLSNLLEKRKQLDLLITNLNNTLASIEGGITMADKEKFTGFKQKLIDNNEQKYGIEIRGKYGNEEIDASNQKLSNMTVEDYDQWEMLGNKIIENLKYALTTNNPASEIAQKTADLHRKWLSYSWSNYSKEAHRGLAQMYVEDERFTAYYDNQIQPGAAKFLRDAIFIYANDN